MATSLPVDIYEILEDKLGRKQAHEIVKAMEYAAGDIARQKKAEQREDLTKKLASKADLLAVKAELQGGNKGPAVGIQALLRHHDCRNPDHQPARPGSDRPVHRRHKIVAEVNHGNNDL